VYSICRLLDVHPVTASDDVQTTVQISGVTQTAAARADATRAAVPA
jgi:hypothetical protein